jgi:hypothetical protein
MMVALRGARRAPGRKGQVAARPARPLGAQPNELRRPRDTARNSRASLFDTRRGQQRSATMAASRARKKKKKKKKSQIKPGPRDQRRAPGHRTCVAVHAKNALSGQVVREPHNSRAHRQRCCSTPPRQKRPISSRYRERAADDHRERPTHQHHHGQPGNVYSRELKGDDVQAKRQGRPRTTGGERADG